MLSHLASAMYGKGLTLLTLCCRCPFYMFSFGVSSVSSLIHGLLYSELTFAILLIQFHVYNILSTAHRIELINNLQRNTISLFLDFFLCRSNSISSAETSQWLPSESRSNICLSGSVSMLTILVYSVEQNNEAYEVQSQAGSDHEPQIPYGYSANQQLAQREGTIRKSRIRDRPESRVSEASSLKIKIELDIEAEVDLYARVKGDVTIGLL